MCDLTKLRVSSSRTRAFRSKKWDKYLPRKTRIQDMGIRAVYDFCGESPAYLDIYLHEEFPGLEQLDLWQPAN